MEVVVVVVVVGFATGLEVVVGLLRLLKRMGVAAVGLSVKIELSVLVVVVERYLDRERSLETSLVRLLGVTEES